MKKQLLQYENSNCVHHWKIESPNGPFSKAYCAKGGEKRKFRLFGKQ